GAGRVGPQKASIGKSHECVRTWLIEKDADNIASAIDAAGLGQGYRLIGIVNRRKAAVAEEETVLFEIAVVKNPDNLSRRIYPQCVSKSCTGNVESYICPGGIKKTMLLVQIINITAYDLTCGVNTLDKGVVSRLG